MTRGRSRSTTAGAIHRPPSPARTSVGGRSKAARISAGVVPTRAAVGLKAETAAGRGSGRRQTQAAGRARDRSADGRRPGGGAGAFQGMSGGSNVRDASNRGQSSRQSIGASGGGGGARATGAGGGGRGGGGGAEAAAAAEGRRARRRGSPVMTTVPEGSKMRQSRTRWLGGRRLRLIGIVLVTVSLAAEWGSSAFAAVTQRRFASVDAAAQALVDAFRSGERKGDAGGPRRRGQPSRLVRRPGV